MNHGDLADLVSEANLAPSVHNTQPTRWRLEPDGRVLVLEDTTRRLLVGDPLGQDAGVSHGAAIEGLALACSARGVDVQVEPLAGGPEGALRPVARLTLLPGGAPDPLRALVPVRRTYRGAFARTAERASLEGLTAQGDIDLATTRDDIELIARLNDVASLRTYRNGAYRAELLSWMRLSPRHPQWTQDGLNAEAMEMSSLEAAGAGIVLKPRVFEALDALRLAGPLTAEAGVVRSAQAVAMFHRPEDETPLQTGRRFHRFWLEVTALGLSAAPMAVLADDAAARTILAKRFDLPPGRRLVTTFRLGRAPERDLGPKPRLSAERLLA